MNASEHQRPNATSLAMKREALLKKSAQQRAQLAASLAPLQTPLALIDTGLLIIKFARKHPLLCVGGVVLALKLTSNVNTRQAIGRYWGTYQMIKKVSENFKREEKKL